MVSGLTGGGAMASCGGVGVRALPTGADSGFAAYIAAFVSALGGLTLFAFVGGGGADALGVDTADGRRLLGVKLDRRGSCDTTGLRPADAVAPLGWLRSGALGALPGSSDDPCAVRRWPFVAPVGDGPRRPPAVAAVGPPVKLCSVDDEPPIVRFGAVRDIGCIAQSVLLSNSAENNDAAVGFTVRVG
jgi:hypothetical protein